MAKLTTEQLLFLTRHKISLGQLFDATGMRHVDYSEIMRKEDKLFAYGTTPCEKEGHTLRSRRGACIECRTVDIAFTLRGYKNGIVYVAASRSRQLVKIGSTTELDRRIISLNNESYGGANDWICVSYVKCEKAGMVEFSAHQKLAAFSFAAQYSKSGQLTDAYELFSCGYSTARIAFVASVPEEDRPKIVERSDSKINYGFADRKNDGKSARSRV